ncbi:MAG: cytochrome c3 family protein [bacterium]
MPSPMDNRPERAKSRASRISLKYYTRPDRFYRARFGFSLLLTLLAIGITGFSFWSSQGSLAGSRHFRLSSLASPGPIANPHALFEAKCEACHRTTESLNPERSAGIFHSAADTSTRCLDCHRDSPHHPNAQKAMEAACASCHQDHQGRNHNLTLAGNMHCTNCHKNLAPAQVATNDRTALSIGSFDPGEHPEFRMHQPSAAGNIRDNGLKFNHAVHLAPGQNLAQGGVGLIKFRDLPEKDRLRYGMIDTSMIDKVVQLNCNSCHHADPADPILAGLNIREPLKNPLPVTFERDCAACHPLSVKSIDNRTLTAAHGLQVDALLDDLRGTFLKEVVRDNPGLLNSPAQKVDIPGQKATALAPPLRKIVEENVEKSAELLLGRAWATAGPNGRRGCVECHEFDKSATGHQDSAGLKVRAVNPTKVTLQSARFDHSRHALVDCKSCHEAQASTRSTDLLMPKIANCMSCHSEQGLSKKASASAGSSCVTCHGYHSLGSTGKAQSLTKPVSDYPQAIQAILKGD